MLSMETPQHQGIYAPLNQAMSDSDSEEEIHDTTKHRQLQQQLNQQQQERFLHSRQQLLEGDIKPNSRPIPPNTLNLVPKTFQQNRRKLQIERQRQLEKSFYQSSHTLRTGSNNKGKQAPIQITEEYMYSMYSSHSHTKWDTSKYFLVG